MCVCVSTTRFLQTHLGTSFGLAAAVGVVVVVGALVSIFVNSVQQPEQELEGVVLRVPPKLRSVLCHRTLRRRETATFIFRLFAKVIKTQTCSQSKGGLAAASTWNSQRSLVQSWPNVDSSKNSCQALVGSDNIT